MFIIKNIKENKIFRKLLNKFIFLFVFFKIKRNKPDNFNHILVLGKGYSLNSLPSQIKKIDKPSLIILTNFNKNDLDNYQLFSSIRKFPILILGNITEPILNFKVLKKLKIFDFYIQRLKIENIGKKKFDSYFSPNLSKIYGKRKSFKYDAYTSNTMYLPNDIHFFLERLRKKKIEFSFNSGLASILLACTFKPKKITLFGFDFYKSNYFNKHLLENMKPKEFNLLTSNSKRFARVFKEIVSFNLGIKFTIFTKHKISLKKKNLVIFCR